MPTGMNPRKESTIKAILEVLFVSPITLGGGFALIGLYGCISALREMWKELCSPWNSIPLKGWILICAIFTIPQAAVYVFLGLGLAFSAYSFYYSLLCLLFK